MFVFTKVQVSKSSERKANSALKQGRATAISFNKLRITKRDGSVIEKYISGRNMAKVLNS
jgi:hypothetical protein